MMRGYRDNGVADVIRLEARVYETAGSPAWWLAQNDVIVGAGMDKTVIRRVGPGYSVVNGWLLTGHKPGLVVSELTIDCNAGLEGDPAPDGIGGFRWRDCRIERVKVIGAGSTDPGKESFGIIISTSTNCVIRDCVLEQNVGGYLSAFTISGQDMAIEKCRATFTWKPGWDTRLQAFCLAGESEGLTIKNNRTAGARFGVFCDTGNTVTRLTVSGNRFGLRDYPKGAATAINLQPSVKYVGTTIINNQTTITK